MTAPILFDRSHWGCIRLTGQDRVRFLHNQTTNNIEQLKEGQGCYTVFVTSTGRTIDLASVYALSDSLLLTVSPGMAKQLYDWMDRYIFFSDKVTLSDESEQRCLFTLLGEGADTVMQAVGCRDLVGQDPLSHQQFNIATQQVELRAAVGSDLAISGYTFWANKEHADTIQQAFLSAGAIAGNREQWETLRIQQGRPMPGAELTEEDNPLEAGLWNSISFEKGCYIGQETIARLNTYQGVKKKLWGIKLDGNTEVGTPLIHDGAKVGKLTSITHSEQGILGLGYVRTKVGGPDIHLEVGNTTGQTVSVPFVRHEYYTSES